MSLEKPAFADLVRHYPASGESFGVTHACAIRMSIALRDAVPDFFAGYARPRRHPTGAITSSSELATYLEEPHVGWPALRLGHGPAAHSAALRLTTQGIIFWDVLPDADQIAFRTRAAAAGSGGTMPLPGSIRASPNHIDLWDPQFRTLRERDGRTMTWFPEAGIVESVWFWEIPVRQGPGSLNPFNLPRGMVLT